MLARLVDEHVPATLRGSVAFEHGMPRYWLSFWIINEAGHLAETTKRRKLRYIESLYEFADQTRGHGFLDRALTGVDIERIGELLFSWFSSILNKARNTQTDRDKWITGLAFIKRIIEWLAPVDEEPLKHWQRKFYRLDSLYSQLQVSKPRPSASIRSLPALVVTELYEILDPGSAKNPFKGQRTRWRLWIFFLLAFLQGLRRGETLVIPADALKSEYDVAVEADRYWLNITNNKYEKEPDKRSSQPNIKTRFSHRQIPVNEHVAKQIEVYVTSFRGKPAHSYLLNSQLNKPLSTESITKAFTKVNQALSKEAKRLLLDKSRKPTVTAHDLRHTSAVIRLNQFLAEGHDMEFALQLLRTFFGWSPKSVMPQRYAHAVFVDRLSTIWSEHFDNHVDILRNLEGTQR